ncbi:hypothetical protein [Psychrobacillus sp.]|uniref:hypothetical protein n=1 Tax=Psychrobacillus sp. TaxID=1871623 RepID=UPI0028BD960D|nr:hypothetical protein [Psychrobacillus sp.]
MKESTTILVCCTTKQRGIEKGIERGIEKGTEQVVRGMLLENLSVELIAKVTELEMERIEQIRIIL